MGASRPVGRGAPRVHLDHTRPEGLITLLRPSAAKTPRADRERGASAVEYGLLIAGIAAIIAITVYLFGAGVSGLFTDTCTSIVSSAGTGTCS